MLMLSCLGALPFAWPLMAHASETFYLDVQKDHCYIFSGYPDDSRVPIEKDDEEYKRLKEVACKAPHHFKVLDVARLPYIDFRVIGPKGDVTTSLRDEGDATYVTLNTQVVRDHCVEVFRATTGKAPQADITSGATYMRWFYPDSGMERHRYHGTTVCYLHKADDRYENYVLMQEQ